MLAPVGELHDLVGLERSLFAVHDSKVGFGSYGEVIPVVLQALGQHILGSGDCAGDVTALYEVRPDGSVRVTNSCAEPDGSTKSAKASAKVVDRETNAKLKVTFFWPFSGDYWIINLGPNYEYAVVGEPGRDYLWILSRTPQMDEATYDVLLERIARQGYDPGRLVRTPQSAR